MRVHKELPPFAILCVFINASTKDEATAKATAEAPPNSSIYGVFEPGYGREHWTVYYERSPEAPQWVYPDDCACPRTKEEALRRQAFAPDIVGCKSKSCPTGYLDSREPKAFSAEDGRGFLASVGIGA